MFDLEKREKFIILFLIIILIAGLSVRLYQKSNQIIDVRIRPFNYEGTGPGEPVKININEADESTLMRLDGVGSTLANRMIEYRNEKGFFRSTEEIKKVKGIGDLLFEKIKEKITVE